ncbi:MAG TPA: protein kinase [Planctomycetia bacterium]|nr:protein kinase [Planctomycetia bacterium]
MLEATSPAPDPGEPSAADLAAPHAADFPYVDLKPLRPWADGEVFLAEHATLHRLVELRFLSPEAATDPARRADFLESVRRAGAVRHAALEHVFESGERAGVPYVAQERCDAVPPPDYGPRPASRTAPLFPIEDLARLAREIAEGLAALHEEGLSHGRICPANVRVEAGGGARLLRAFEPGPPDESPRRFEPPPEAGLTNPFERDLYSFGVTFAALLCPEAPPPSNGRFRSALRRAHPGVSRSLARVLARCVGKSREGPFAGARELAAELRRIERSSVTPATNAAWIAGTLIDLAAAAIMAMIGMMAVLIGLSLKEYAARGDFGQHPITTELRIAWLLGGMFVLPLLALTLCEHLFGWTPGRRVRGIWLADFSGERPRLPRLLLRGLLRFALIGAGAAVAFAILQSLEWIGRPAPSALAVFLYAALGGATYFARFLTPARQCLHDLWTGVLWVAPREAALARVEFPFAPSASAPAPERDASETLTATYSAGATDRAAESEAAESLAAVAHYEVEDRLGQGGMGIVYRASDRALGRTVAIKVLGSATLASPVQVRRFEREARLAARLSHENVARVWGYGSWRERPYMVMEYVEGANLQHAVNRRGRLPVSEAWDYVRQAAAGLAAADALGIVHRDVKPSNLMLTPAGVVKVTDFGLSKLDGLADVSDPEAEGEEFSPALVPSLTRTGAVMGTPLYMSPEQATGRPVDRRSDIYSLGLTLYFLLAGRPAHSASDAPTLMAKQATEAPPELEGRVPDLTAGQAAVLRRMIAKDPALRFADYATLIEALASEAPRGSTYAPISARLRAAGVNVVLFLMLMGAVQYAASQAWKARQRGEEFKVEFDEGAPALSYLVGLLPTAWFIWYCLREYRGGAPTYGKRTFRLRVMREDGGAPTWRQAIVRFATLFPLAFLAVMPQRAASTAMTAEDAFEFIVLLLNLGALIASLTMIAWDAKKRGLHDRAAGTIVVLLPPGGGRRGWLARAWRRVRRDGGTSNPSSG